MNKYFWTFVSDHTGNAAFHGHLTREAALEHKKRLKQSEFARCVGVSKKITLAEVKGFAAERFPHAGHVSYKT